MPKLSERQQLSNDLETASLKLRGWSETFFFLARVLRMDEQFKRPTSTVDPFLTALAGEPMVIEKLLLAVTDQKTTQRMMQTLYKIWKE